jgi:hypothetical protein
MGGAARQSGTAPMFVIAGLDPAIHDEAQRRNP